MPCAKLDIDVPLFVMSYQRVEVLNQVLLPRYICNGMNLIQFLKGIGDRSSFIRLRLTSFQIKRLEGGFKSLVNSLESTFSKLVVAVDCSQVHMPVSWRFACEMTSHFFQVVLFFDS